MPGLQRFETAVRPAGAECEIDRYLAGDPKTERRFSAVSSEFNAALREVGETVLARHADSLDDLRAEHERLIDEISGIEQRFQELAERIALAFRDIRADLNAERPDLGQWEWPQPSEPKEDPDSLFDSRRSYVEQIDRYKRHQGKPTARRKRNGEVTS